MDDYLDVGPFHRPITTSSKETQLWFDRGVSWCFGFNHDEGLQCFEKALENDADCAMAHWGVAYALGPNYNKSWQMFDPKDLEACVERAHRSVERAESLAGAATPVDKALVRALRARFPQNRPGADLAAWNVAYADAMALVYRDFPDDLDVAALYADALMSLTPWALWDLKTGKPAPGSRVIEAKAVFDRAFERDRASWSHPGLLHFFIHLIEMSSTPEAGLRAADHLRLLCPDAGHLEHMPSHLDVLVGDYRAAIASNAAAVRADKKYAARYGVMNFYSVYRMHTYQSLIYAAMLAGKSRLALDTCDDMESTLPELLRSESPPMADWLEAFVSVRMHVLVRFGRWQDIIELDLPTDAELYCVTTAMTHYAKGVALAATGRVDEADEQRVLFRAALKRVPPSRLDFPNKCVDILAVAGAMLEGELEYRRKNFDVAWKHLRKAVELDDNLVYSEPWGWMVPTRHALGALLLEQGHVEEASEVYAADLGFDTSLPPGHRHPNNVFALHGYHECLMKLGRTAEAKLLEQSLQIAAAVADVPVKSSCFCRLETEIKLNGAKGANGSCH